MSGSMEFWQSFCRNRAAVVGLGIVAAILLMVVAAPLLYPGDPADMVAPPFLWPLQDREFPFGSDVLGRDLGAEIFHGAHVSLLIGATATAAAVTIGIVVGALAGYYGGPIDDALMGITEVMQTIPPFVLAIIVVAAFRPSLETIVLAISVVSWPAVARLVRAEVLSLREREFVQAGIAIGMTDLRIILTQILPNALTPVIVAASLMMATSILIEAGLAFLGLGDPNVISWGAIIGAGRDSIRDAWYISAVPGIAIFAAVLGLNLVGEGLADALNPRLRRR
jgi:peptide/nickel transport system permease protein